VDYFHNVKDYRYNQNQKNNNATIEHTSRQIPDVSIVESWIIADPEKDKTATKYSQISFDEVYSKGLNVMDLTAFTLCKENNLPIIVFDMDTPGNLRKLMEGAPVGTLVCAS
jgi:uridylate kinase